MSKSDMKNLPWILLACLFVGPAFSQTPVQTPPPSDEKDVVRISTNLIQIDVSVTNKKGEPITDLKQDEITIFENGKQQAISNFSFVPGARPAPTTKEKKNATVTASPPTPGTKLAPEQVRRTIVLVVDDMNLSFSSFFWVRKALKEYINEQMQEGDMIAIVRSSSGMGALQQFTTDKRLLMAAVDNLKSNLRFQNPMMFERADLNEGEERFAEFQSLDYSNGTLGTLHYVISGMRYMPGRKSVVLLSDGWLLYPQDRDGKTVRHDRDKFLPQLVDYANRNSVVFYTINAAGVQFPGLTASDNIENISQNRGQTTRILNRRINLISGRQEPLSILAEDTGGLRMVRNDIDGAIRKAMDDQSYYLVGYVPDDDSFDPQKRRFNRFEVKVTRPGAKIRYRSGFFSFSEEELGKSKMSGADSINAALSSPFAATDIDVRMNAIFVADEKKNTHAKAFINVDSRGLTFTKEPTGNHKTSFDIVAITTNAGGQVMDERSRNFTLRLDEKEYAKMLNRGLITNFVFPVTRPGGYQVRLVVRDAASGKMGSSHQFLHVPNLKRNRLTLSGIALASDAEDGGDGLENEALRDTALRRFRPGETVNFAYQIFDAKPSTGPRKDLVLKMKLYAGERLITEFAPEPVAGVNESPEIISATGGIRLGTALAAGDYVLQIEVTDPLAKGKERTALQFVYFEVIR